MNDSGCCIRGLEQLEAGCQFLRNHIVRNLLETDSALNRTYGSVGLA